MGIYANEIFNNWAYHATNTTKVKKPYMEHLVFRGLQCRSVAILRSVGFFPTLKSVKFIPALQVFEQYCEKNNSNLNQQIKYMLGWIGKELSKKAPTNPVEEEKKT